MKKTLLPLIAIALALGILGCRSGEDRMTPRARAFIDLAAIQLKKAEAAVTPVMALPGAPGLDQALIKFVGQNPEVKKLGMGVLIMGLEGKLIAGRRPYKNGTMDIMDHQTGLNYSYFGKFKSLIEKPGVAQLPLYTPWGKSYTVCKTTIRQGRTLGLTCVFFPIAKLPPEAKPNEMQFMALEFKGK